MARMTYRPHIRVEKPGAYWAVQGVRYYECIGYGSAGIGLTPKQAYDDWYQQFIDTTYALGKFAYLCGRGE